jgi:hypothetical protein
MSASASSSSAWPTPATRDHKGANGEDHLSNGTGRLHLDQLPNFVEHVWAKQWATPRATEDGQWQNANREQTKQTLTLTRQAYQWPTPTSLSFGESHQPGNSKSMNDTLDLASSLRDRLTYLAGAESSKERRSLNPLFVEWLMGWPPGWTLLAWTDFACSATGLCLFKQRMRFALSQLGSPTAAPPAQLALFG